MQKWTTRCSYCAITRLDDEFLAQRRLSPKTIVFDEISRVNKNFFDAFYKPSYEQDNFIYNHLNTSNKFIDQLEKNTMENIRQHRIYREGCTATRTMWCDRNGDYYYPKDMDTLYLHNVVKLLRTVAEAKIFDAQRVVKSPLSPLKTSAYHIDVANMNIDEYCYHNFICWESIKFELSRRGEWKHNYTQFINPVIPTPTKLESEVIKKTETNSTPELASKIEILDKRISNLVGHTVDTYNKLDSLAFKQSNLTDTVTKINNILNNLLEPQKKVVKKRKK